MPSPCVVEPFNVREDRRPRRLSGSGHSEATGLRQRRALSLRELSALSGVNYNSIWRIEAERTEAKPQTGRRLAAALGVEAHKLLKGEDDG